MKPSQSSHCCLPRLPHPRLPLRRPPSAPPPPLPDRLDQLRPPHPSPSLCISSSLHPSILAPESLASGRPWRPSGAGRRCRQHSTNNPTTPAAAGHLPGTRTRPPPPPAAASSFHSNPTTTLADLTPSPVIVNLVLPKYHTCMPVENIMHVGKAAVVRDTHNR